MDSLEMPNALSGGSVERNQAICKEVVAKSIRTVKIICRGTGGDVHNSSPRIDGHAGPIVRACAVGPGIFRPGLVTEFTGMRDRVEGPCQVASAHAVCTNVAWRTGQG